MIKELVSFAIQTGGWMEMDRVYLENKLKELVDDKEIEEFSTVNELALALADGNETVYAQLLDYVTPPPSVVNAYFAEYYHKSAKEATAYYFELEKQTGFMEAAKEKTPKDFLSFDSEGVHSLFNRRFIRMNLGGESWGFQLLPVSEKEMGIVFPENVTDFSCDEKKWLKALEIAEIFPHYFVSFGSNFFVTEVKNDENLIGNSMEFKDYLLVDGKVNREEKELILTGYNREELVQLALKVGTNETQKISVFYEKNSFTILFTFKTKERLETVLEKL
jgi:galactose-1-phosphate uridylyltransferase